MFGHKSVVAFIGEMERKFVTYGKVEYSDRLILTKQAVAHVNPSSI